MNENSFKKYVIGIMGTSWDVQSHEDMHSCGVPDLSFGINRKNGWIELKHAKRWNPKSPVRMRHYTIQQINWINNRGEKGGNCFILVKIATDYFILNHDKAEKVAKGMFRDEYIDNSIMHWEGSINKRELIQVLIYGN